MYKNVQVKFRAKLIFVLNKYHFISAKFHFNLRTTTDKIGKQ